MESLTDRELPETVTLEAGPRFSLRRYFGPLLGISIFLMSIGRRIWGNNAAVTLLLVAVAAFALAALVQRLRCQWRACRVTFSRKLLQIERRSGTTEIEFNRITGLSVSRQDVYAEGRWLGSDRKVGLWYDPPLAMHHDTEHFVPLVFQVTGENGPVLEGYLRVVQEQLLQQAELRLAADDEISGDGWRWNTNGLRFADRPQTLHDPAKEYLTCETLHGKLRIWQAGIPTPITVLPADTRDVWLLRELIERRSPSRPPRETHKRSGPLGRLIFERHATDSLRYRLWCAAIMTLGAIALAVALLILLFAMGRGGRMGRVVAPTVILGMLGVGALRIAYSMSRSSFRFYENAVRRKGVSSDQILLLSDIDVFSFDVRRQRSYGRYTGTLVSMVFADLSRSGVGLFYSLTVPHVDEELEELKDAVSSHLAARMARTLGETGRMQWTPELWFHREHLSYRPRGWFRTRGESIDVKYDDISKAEELEGCIQLWTADSEKPLVKVKTNSPNYHPGFLVFERLLALRQPAEVGR